MASTRSRTNKAEFLPPIEQVPLSIPAEFLSSPLVAVHPQLSPEVPQEVPPEVSPEVHTDAESKSTHRPNSGTDSLISCPDSPESPISSPDSQIKIQFGPDTLDNSDNSDRSEDNIDHASDFSEDECEYPSCPYLPSITVNVANSQVPDRKPCHRFPRTVLQDYNEYIQVENRAIHIRQNSCGLPGEGEKFFEGPLNSLPRQDRSKSLSDLEHPFDQNKLTNLPLCDWQTIRQRIEMIQASMKTWSVFQGNQLDQDNSDEDITDYLDEEENSELSSPQISYPRTSESHPCASVAATDATGRSGAFDKWSSDGQALSPTLPEPSSNTKKLWEYLAQQSPEQSYIHYSLSHRTPRRRKTVRELRGSQIPAGIPRDKNDD
uniref:ARAD1C24024p n=1 Tax=Blastobotrys adeninivorans TaxID=409370 RepID=A0A060T1V7_BLAAD